MLVQESDLEKLKIPLGDRKKLMWHIQQTCSTGSASPVTTKSTAGDPTGATSHPAAPSQVDIVFLQSAPLVHNGLPVQLLNFKAEKDLIRSCFDDANKRIRASFDFATSSAVIGAINDRATVLHISGESAAAR